MTVTVMRRQARAGDKGALAIRGTMLPDHSRDIIKPQHTPAAVVNRTVAHTRSCLHLAYEDGEAIVRQMGERLGRALQKLHATPAATAMDDEGAQFARPP